VNLRDETAAPDEVAPGNTGGGRRLAWHLLAMLLTAAVLWLVFAAYRQPDLILDFAGARLC
jgi:hypothetical protein